jgi:hypothetical protein
VARSIRRLPQFTTKLTRPTFGGEADRSDTAELGT